MASLVANSADSWQSIASRHLIPHVCHSFQDGFSGVLRHTSVTEGVSLTQVETSGIVIERTERLARGTSRNDLHLSFQLRSSGQVSNAERAVRVLAGQVVTYAAHEPYRLDYSRPDQHQFILQIPATFLQVDHAVAVHVHERMMLQNDTSSRALFRYARRVFNSDPYLSTAPAASDHFSEIAHALGDLASAMLRTTHSQQLILPRTARGLLLTVQNYIEEEFASPRLTTESLAAQHFISRRRLYQLFEREGVGPADMIRHRRLAHSLRLLRLTGMRLSISEVAEQSGFTDATTFSRAFQRRYGLTPRDFKHTISADAHQAAAIVEGPEGK